MSHDWAECRMEAQRILDGNMTATMYSVKCRRDGYESLHCVAVGRYTFTDIICTLEEKLQWLRDCGYEPYEWVEG